MALDFYHGHGSPFSWRVWLALEYKKIPYNLKVLSFQAGDTRKPEFVAINPRHQVPTIVDDGFVLWESMAILEYLDERFDAAPKLYPGDVRERARIRRLAREVEQYAYAQGIDRIVDELFWKGDAPPDAKVMEESKQKLAEELEGLAKEMNGDWLGGGAMTAADITLCTVVAYIKRVTVRKPETALTQLLPPKIEAWAKRIEALPYFDKTFPPHWK
jgi:glutathione S-transferase